MVVVTGVQEDTATPQVGHRFVPGSSVSPHVEQRMIFGPPVEIRTSYLVPYDNSQPKIHQTRPGKPLSSTRKGGHARY